MQVLEMEDMEALVGNSNRKRLGDSSRKRNSSKFDILLSFFQQGDILPKLVVTASVILLGLLYLSAHDDPVPIIEGKDHGSSNNVALTRTASPTSATLPPTEPDTTAATEKTVEDNGENNAFKYSKYATILPLVDHALPSEEVKEEYAEKYGNWHFWDGDEDERPMEDYTSKYPNRDIPGEDFPDYAWQADAVYVNHILNDADLLISRTMEAIFVEYGHGKPLPPEGLAARMRMFHWSREDLSGDNVQLPEKYRKFGDRGNGGWTTKRSHAGLVRRLLHAMMTQDTFTVVMGGHSAAQGEGNHFRQSYMMQFHKVMYPVFARVGVKLITRNVGQGGLGTIQAGMGSGSIYGDEVDILMWDSGMTENVSDHVDVFYRQGLLAGNRVPVLWGGPFELLKMLHEEADVDVGDWGTAMDGIPEVESHEHAETLPWAARYLKCKEGAEDVCKEEPRFCSKCWIDREDNIKPETEQLEKPRGQVKWHPGWRRHQLTGRNLAFALLDALQAAVNIWTEGVMGGPPLDDEEWHVTEYYENIRNKVKNLDDKLGSCYNIADKLPTRLCNTPMKAKTQYTPRANFHQTALTSIIKPTSDGYVPQNEKQMLYEGPDAHNTCFDIPEGEVDVFNVVTGRRALSGDGFRDQSLSNMPRTGDSIDVNTNRMLGGKIEPGSGWIVRGEPPGLCDGTYNATCGRSTTDECVLYGHHDGRGAVVGNENSGWLVMTLDDLKEGLIILKLHTWYTEAEGPANNDSKRQADRKLTRNYETPELPDEFIFEYAIDGKITSLAKDAFLEQKQQIQRVVEIITILDDPNFTSESKDVEIAIRLRGSGRAIVFGVSHVYWA